MLLPGNMVFLKMFIRGRHFNVRVGNIYSDPYSQEELFHRVLFFPSRYLVSRLIVIVYQGMW